MIGILHPGAMGSAVAAAARSSGQAVAWASSGRSDRSVARADQAGLEDLTTIAELCDRCQAIMSVCPPGAAVDVAREISQEGFEGLYLDANAISPDRSREVGAIVRDGGADFVDGGIVGGPGFSTGRTTLYLSGLRAEEVAGWFSSSDLKTNILGVEIGLASAIKMSFAAYTKGTTALLGAILALAEHEGVREALMEQWRSSHPDLADKAEARVCQTTAKAWRFWPEMEEISSTFKAAGLPGGFHSAASVVYRRQAGFKNMETPPELDIVLRATLAGNR